MGDGCDGLKDETEGDGDRFKSCERPEKRGGVEGEGVAKCDTGSIGGSFMLSCSSGARSNDLGEDDFLPRFTSWSPEVDPATNKGAGLSGFLGENWS